MILKSFEIENNIKAILKYKFIVIYGENIGLKEKLKKDIIKLNNKQYLELLDKILRLNTTLTKKPISKKGIYKVKILDDKKNLKR